MSLSEDLQAQNFGREIVSSADLCYNDVGDENGEQKRTAEKKKYTAQEL